MGAVMIHCPKTGTAIATGIEADLSSFNRTPVFIAQCYCPYCQTDHEWFAKDAWVQEGRHERRQQNARDGARCEAA